MCILLFLVAHVFIFPRLGEGVLVVISTPPSSRAFLHLMVERGRYVFAVPKIDDIRSLRKAIAKTIGVRASIHEVHSEAGADRVSSQLRLLKRDLDRKVTQRPFLIVLTTHAAMLSNDWKSWSGFELIIDEVPEVFVSAEHNIKEYPLDGLIRIGKIDDGECHRVRITTNLRNPNSDKPVTIYVFSKKQAEYLRGRMGGTLEHVGDKLPTSVTASAPKPAPLTDAERQRVSQWAKKMIKAGVSHFHDLPDSGPKRKVDQKLVPMIERLSGEKIMSEMGVELINYK